MRNFQPARRARTRGEQCLALSSVLCQKVWCFSSYLLLSEKRPNASPPDSDRRLSQTEMALELKRPDLMSVFEHQGDTLFEGLDTLVRNGLIYKHHVKAIRRDLHTPTEGDYSNVSLVVLPTGSGKTGVGVMAAYVCKAKRVLVVTPSVTTINTV